MTEQELNDKIAKLPAWARQHIETLQFRASEAEAMLRQETTGANCPPVNMWALVPGIDMRRQEYAPTRHRIARFVLDPAHPQDSWIEVRLSDNVVRRGNELTRRATLDVRGYDTIVVRLRSSNVVEVELER